MKIWKALAAAFCLTLILSSAAFADVEISVSNFPDAVFREYIRTRMDRNHDDMLSNDERLDVLSIDVSDRDIESLQGIEFFTYLRSLEFSNTNVSCLDWEMLDECTIESITCYNGKITELDCSGLLYLRRVEIKQCPLTEFNANGCRGLEYLWIDDCPLTTMNLDMCDCLTTLACYDGKLTELDVSDCFRLETLRCNGNQLTELNVSGLRWLTELDCYDNPLTALNANGCSSLKKLYCNEFPLTELNLTGCIALESLKCYKCQIEELDLTGCGMLKELDCGYGRLKKLNVSGCVSLETLACSFNQIQELSVKDCVNLRELDCSGNSLVMLDLTNNYALTKVQCYNCSRRINPVNNEFDMSSFPGFDVSRMEFVHQDSNRLEGTIAKFDRTWGSTGARYIYDCGNGWTVGFYLIFCNTVELEFYHGVLDEDDLPSRHKLTRLYNTLGNYSWDLTADEIDKERKISKENIGDNYNVLSMRIIVSNLQESEMKGRLKITLPEDFSFNEDTVVNEYPGSFDYCIQPEESQHWIIPVYPLYSETVSDRIKVRITGDIETVVEFPIEEKPNGVIKMRPTSLVNMADTSPVWEQITVKPVADFIVQDPRKYSDRLAILGCTLSQAVYNVNKHETTTNTYIVDSLHNLGFSNIRWHQNDSKNNYHDVASAFATKKVVKDGEVYTVVMIVVRGTVDLEWIGNMNVEGPDLRVHADFQTCADKVMDRHDEYVGEMGITPNEKTKVYICGHSRGGAVANLLADKLNEIYGIDSLYAYTFASPNCTKDAKPWPNIINFCYKYDIVPFVPQGGYTKHGVTRIVGGSDAKTAPGNVKEAFKKYTLGRPFYDENMEPYPVGNELLIGMLSYGMFDEFNGWITKHQKWLGNMQMTDPLDMYKFQYDSAIKIAKAHGAENYCAWTIANGDAGSIEYEEYMNIAQGRFVQKYENIGISIRDDGTFGLFCSAEASYGDTGAVVISVHCPVDVEVRDGEGAVLAVFRDHQVIKEADWVIAYGDGESSYIALPEGTDYRLTVTGTGSGTMDVDYLYTEDYSSVDDRYVISAVPVEPGAVFTMMKEAQPGVTPVMISDEDYLYTPDAVFEPESGVWGEPMFEWSEDWSTCTATFINGKYDAMLTKEAAVTSETIAEPTETQFGRVRYTATVVLGSDTYTGEMFVTLPSLSGNAEITLTQRGKNAYGDNVYMDGREYIVTTPFADGMTGLTFKSSKPKVASIDKTTGKLTLKAPGKTTITATATEMVQKGKKTVKKKVKATVALTVVHPEIPVSISIAQEVPAKAGEVYIGKEDGCRMKVTGVSGMEGERPDTACTWKSSKPKILKVDKNTGDLTPLKAGTAKITATSRKNKKAKATIVITVVDLTVPEDIVITNTETAIQIGQPLKLEYELVRRDPDVPAASAVTWKTDNKKIAKVDRNGLVTGLKYGTVTITAKTAVGKKTATITLNVVEGEGTAMVPDLPAEEPDDVMNDEPVFGEPSDEPIVLDGPIILDESIELDEPVIDEEWNDWYDEVPDTSETELYEAY